MLNRGHFLEEINTFEVFFRRRRRVYVELTVAETFIWFQFVIIS